METLSSTQSFEKKAFVGDLEPKKVDAISAKIDSKKVLNHEIDSNTKAIGILHGDEFELKADSVKNLQVVLVDIQKTPKQKNLAERNLDLLSKSVYWTMLNGSDEQQDLLGRGSALDIDSYLPEAFKGLGEKVIGNIIKNEEIKNLLKDLDSEKGRYDLRMPVRREKYANKIAEKIDLLDEMPLTDEVQMVTAYLSHECLNLTSNNKVNTPVDVNVEMLEAIKKMTAAAEKMGKGVKQRINPETGEYEGVESAWTLSYKKAAEGMKFMADDLRWSDWTPPEWYNDLDSETQYRVSLMMMVNEGAAWTNKFGPDLEKIKGNPIYKSFDNEKFSALFNEDFKLVTSKMLHDLCEPYIDQNGKTSMRYKEVFYKKDGGGEWIYKMGSDGKPELDIFGDKLKVKGIYGVDNGGYDIDHDVILKLVGIRDYKEELADFIAEKNNSWEKYAKDDKMGHKKGEYILDEDGKKIADVMSKMNAYTAWNLFYMFGDSSLADRMRMLPTYGGIINDGIRSLNPEKKALSKWKIEKGGVESSDTVKGAEWYGGTFGPYVQTVMKLEEDLGQDVLIGTYTYPNGKKEDVYKRISKPIDGNETLREKVVNGKLPIFANKTMYGFMDFVSGTRDLRKSNGERFSKNDNMTLGTLLWDYADFDNSGKLINKTKKTDFSFGRGQVDFLNWYRDQEEASALVFNCMMGKEDAREPDKLVSKIRTAFGMVDEIKINGEKAFSYTTRPDLWANIILGSFGGIDMQRLSTDHIRLKINPHKNENGKMITAAYNLEVYGLLTNVLGLSNSDVNLNAIMRYLGVDLQPGENPTSFGVSIRNETKFIDEKLRTDKLLKQRKNNFVYDGKGVVGNRDSDFNKLQALSKDFQTFRGAFKNGDAKRIYYDLSRAIKSGDLKVAEKLWDIFNQTNN